MVEDPNREGCQVTVAVAVLPLYFLCPGLSAIFFFPVIAPVSIQTTGSIVSAQKSLPLS